MNIIDTITDPNLLGNYFEGRSWANWRLMLRAVYGLPMTALAQERFRKLADREPPPGRVREAFFCIGRRGGKDSICSAIATHAAIYGDFQPYMRPGEKAVILCLAATKQQATGLFKYIRSYFEENVLMQPLVTRMTDWSIELSTGAEIIVGSSNFRSIRGKTIAVAILNELAFWRDEAGGSANPDSEIYSAVLPSLITLRKAGSMLIGISSVHRKQGLLYDKFIAHHAKDDPSVLVVKAPSITFNPTIDQEDIDLDMALDPEKARAEWLSEWRTDISTFIDRSLIEELIDYGCRERPYESNIHNYSAFVDESGGAGSDASTLAIVHADPHGVIIQDAMRIWKPPFSPASVINEKCALLKQYHIRRIIGDKWAAQFPVERYQSHGIHFEQSAKPKSDLYIDLLHILNSRRCRLLDNPQTINELCALERRTRWGGHESIDHPQGGNAHDDAANALAGSVVLASTKPAPMQITASVLQRSRMPMRRSYG
jgi:hypothetical protein